MRIDIYTDGASRGNPGDASWAFVFVSDRGDILEQASGYIGIATNNIAEYTAITEALEYALRKYPHMRFVLHSDSQVVIRQIKGEYRVSAPHLRKYHNTVAKLTKNLHVDFVYVPRENRFVSMCDRMCNEMLDSVQKIKHSGGKR